MMKKIALSVIVIFGFIGYSFYLKINKSVPTSITVGQTSVQKNVLIETPTPASAVSILSPTTTEQNNIQSQSTKSLYKDGNYAGSVADAVYGNIQVNVIISNGKITNVTFLQYPNDQETSQEINQQADPQLAQEAIQAQSANVDIISGATQSSQAFIQSMQDALVKAKS